MVKGKELPPATPNITKKRIWIYKVIACTVPMVFLIFLELILRVVGYGHSTSLFITSPDDSSKWVMNAHASAPFFSDTVNATKGYTEAFSKNKSPRTLRIFVLGESTTAGYPYFHNGSFHRWLKYRLMHTFPEKNVEVVNVSLTAVNSFAVLDFGEQLLRYQPDAVLTYVGHNEYYGALGVGSTSRISGNRQLIKLIINLRKLRTFQLFQNISSRLFPGSSANSINERENLMKRMAAKQHIQYDSDDFKKGIQQFTENITELSDLYSKKHIPLLISNLVSNEKNLPPFVSSGKERNAAKLYHQAIAAYRKCDFVTAKKEFLLAKDYDELRFRAPEAMDLAIQQISQRYPRVYLVDTRACFEKYSAGRILGKETLLEHVHPNLLGYAILSDAFYSAMKKAGLIQPSPSREIKFDSLLTQMPITKMDSLVGVYEIMMLETGWPFSRPIAPGFKRGNSMEEQLAGALAVNRISWLEAMDNLFKYYMKQGQQQNALKVTEQVLLERPTDVKYYIFAGRLSFSTGMIGKSFFYFDKAYQIDPSLYNVQSLFVLSLKCDSLKRALTYLNQMRAYNFGKEKSDKLESVILRIVQLKSELAKFRTARISDSISTYYNELNAPEAAEKYKSHDR